VILRHDDVRRWPPAVVENQVCRASQVGHPRRLKRERPPRAASPPKARFGWANSPPRGKGNGCAGNRKLAIGSDERYPKSPSWPGVIECTPAGQMAVNLPPLGNFSEAKLKASAHDMTRGAGSRLSIHAKWSVAREQLRRHVQP
jgi:hypothetical protein